MIWVLLLVAVAVLAFVLSERWRRPMDDVARATAPGRFADLAGGRTHFRFEGPVRGPVAVCLHGISTGGYVMDEVSAALQRMGYRVLCPDLYGRGFSDRPGGAQDSAFFLRQLSELLDHLDLHQGLTLVGFSMGGAVATAFTAAEPHRVDRLVLIASTGLGQRPPRPARLAADLPVLGDWIVRVLGGWQLRRMVRTLGRTTDIPQALIVSQLDETRIRGFMPAVLSSLRGILSEDMAPAHRRIARTDIPVLAIWAEADEVIPLVALGRLAQINRQAMQACVAGATHTLPVTHARDIRTALQEFLRET